MTRKLQARSERELSMYELICELDIGRENTGRPSKVVDRVLISRSIQRQIEQSSLYSNLEENKQVGLRAIGESLFVEQSLDQTIVRAEAQRDIEMHSI